LTPSNANGRVTTESVVYYRSASVHPRLYIEGATIYRSTATPSPSDCVWIPPVSSIALVALRIVTRGRQPRDRRAPAGFSAARQFNHSRA
jgi:hypothetical protein